MGNEPTNGNDTQPSPVFELHIVHNVATAEFGISGAKRDIVVSIGMLEYALLLLRREDALQAARALAARAPLVRLPGGRG
jgi:hypothetical protein